MCVGRYHQAFALCALCAVGVVTNYVRLYMCVCVKRFLGWPLHVVYVCISTRPPICTGAAKWERGSLLLDLAFILLNAARAERLPPSPPQPMPAMLRGKLHISKNAKTFDVTKPPDLCSTSYKWSFRLLPLFYMFHLNGNCDIWQKKALLSSISKIQICFIHSEKNYAVAALFRRVRWSPLQRRTVDCSYIINRGSPNMPGGNHINPIL